MRLDAKDAAKLRAGGDEFRPHLLDRHRLHVNLPAIMVVAMDADFEPGGADGAHRFGVAAADMRRRQQGAVQQRAQPVNLHDARAADFLEKTRTKNARDRAARLIRSERKKKRGRGADRPAIGHELRHTHPRAAVRIDIDFERKANRHEENPSRYRAAAQAARKTLRGIELELDAAPAKHPSCNPILL